MGFEKKRSFLRRPQFTVCRAIAKAFRHRWATHPQMQGFLNHLKGPWVSAEVIQYYMLQIDFQEVLADEQAVISFNGGAHRGVQGPQTESMGHLEWQVIYLGSGDQHVSWYISATGRVRFILWTEKDSDGRFECAADMEFDPLGEPFPKVERLYPDRLTSKHIETARKLVGAVLDNEKTQVVLGLLGTSGKN